VVRGAESQFQPKANGIRWLTLLFCIGSGTTLLGQDPCADLQDRIAATYDFKPANLSKEEQKVKAAAMDKFWQSVQANPARDLPCLVKALRDTNADPWFRFDGSALLVKLDPSPASKALQVRHWARADLDDVDLRIWVQTLALRATEDFDIAEGVQRWIQYPKARYFLPEHGAVEVNRAMGAMFLLGCMEESRALSALTNILAGTNHPLRAFALGTLFTLATPESIAASRQFDLASFPKELRLSFSNALAKPPRLAPRKGAPKITREEYVKAFEAGSTGNWAPFDRLVIRVPDGEKDAVVVLNRQDLPLLRKVRRLRLAHCNQHALSYYRDFTAIIFTLLDSDAASN